jgi:hypothetical protein
MPRFGGDADVIAVLERIERLLAEILSELQTRS